MATARSVEYAARAPIEAKGKREPVPAWTALGPGRGAAGGLGAALVGRVEELAVLTALAARVERVERDRGRRSS